MSFAIGIFDADGKDLIVATDRRWVDGALGNYRVLTNVAVKNIRLNQQNALAFTGHTEIIAKVIAGLYGVNVCVGITAEKILDKIEEDALTMKGRTDAIERRLNAVIPEVMAGYDERYGLSVILAGVVKKQPEIVWWARNGAWEGHHNSYGEDPYIATMPPEAKCDSPLYKKAHGILHEFDVLASERIKRAVEALSSDPSVQSVSGTFLMRRASRGFKLTPGKHLRKKK
jgi:hypothetical protein